MRSASTNADVYQSGSVRQEPIETFAFLLHHLLSGIHMRDT